MIINLSQNQFKNRDVLDRYVERLILKTNPLDCSIEGTKDELDKLSLSEEVTIYGVSILLLPDPVVEKPLKTKKTK